MIQKLYSYKGVDIYRTVSVGLNSNMYCLFGENKCAILVDPCVSEEIREFIKNNNVDEIRILLTHEHYDHISGVNYFRTEFDNVTVICSSACAINIELPEKNLALYWEVLLSGMDEENRKAGAQIMDLDYSCKADLGYNCEYDFVWNEIKIKMVCAPGHSPGGSIIYLDDAFVFSGDNLVNGNGVICRWPGGSKKDYLQITKPILCDIGRDTIVFPGHGEPGYIAELIRYTEMFKK